MAGVLDVEAQFLGVCARSCYHVPVPHRAYRFRIYPTPGEVSVLESWAGASRFVYNAALEQRRDWWRHYRRDNGHSITWVTQSREVSTARKEIPWLAEIPRSILEYALKDLDRAFRVFFESGGFPRFRRKEESIAFRMQAQSSSLTPYNRKWGKLKLAKGLSVKARITRQLGGPINSITISCGVKGWYASIQCERPSTEPLGLLGLVGIDRGIAANLCLSNGELYSLPATLVDRQRARAAAQRRMAARKMGSKRRAKARAHLARRSAEVAAARRHWLHERSTDIARRFGVVALEKLATANMTRSARGKRGLNRSILNQGWAIFAAMLDYKLADRGGELFYVNPAYTSQTCSSCGSVDARSRKSQAVFECVDCGHRAHADVNAAINILRRSPAGVEGSGYGPVEARTGEMLTHLENLAA